MKLSIITVILLGTMALGADTIKKNEILQILEEARKIANYNDAQNPQENKEISQEIVNDSRIKSLKKYISVIKTHTRDTTVYINSSECGIIKIGTERKCFIDKDYLEEAISENTTAILKTKEVLLLASRIKNLTRENTQSIDQVENLLNMAIDSNSYTQQFTQVGITNQKATSIKLFDGMIYKGYKVEFNDKQIMLKSLES